MAGPFDDITYDKFRARALDETLTENLKIGHLDSYRNGKEGLIFTDIEAKLPALTARNKTVVDIGCGCGELARTMIRACAQRGHRLVMVDSPEMLALLPQDAPVEFRPHRFPHDAAFLDEFHGKADAVLMYGVLSVEFIQGDAWRMFDEACALLAGAGRALIADLPNRTMRRRLFLSQNGIAFHRAFTGLDTPPPLPPDGIAPGEIDDAVILGLLMRARAAGLHGYVVPQAPGLPFFNRREDLLIERP